MFLVYYPNICSFFVYFKHASPGHLLILCRYKCQSYCRTFWVIMLVWPSMSGVPMEAHLREYICMTSTGNAHMINIGAPRLVQIYLEWKSYFPLSGTKTRVAAWQETRKRYDTSSIKPNPFIDVVKVHVIFRKGVEHSWKTSFDFQHLPHLFEV